MTSPIETNNVVDQQFERLMAVEDALANGAHFADDPECHPLYPHAVAARQILQAHVQSLSDRIDVLEGAVEHACDLLLQTPHIIQHEVDDLRASLTQGGKNVG